MILGVDVGGTKTLIGVFDNNGKLTETFRFETPASYPEFLKKLAEARKNLKQQAYDLAVAGVPGVIDHQKGVVKLFGRLGWKNVAVRDDFQKLFGCKTMLENDAKLAAISEAKAWDAEKMKVLYITVGTGIGTALVENGVLDNNLLDFEGGFILLPFEGKLQTWQDFASGRAISKRYGKPASEITDEKQWQEIGENLALGIIDLCAVVQPDLVIIGGGVGTHFAKYQPYLASYFGENRPKLVADTKIVGAKDPNQAVLKGCYVYAKQANKS